MKKRLLSFAAVAAALLAAVSCSLDSISVLSDAVQPQEIGIRTLGSDPGTKSAIDGTAFPQGYDMMVSAFKNVGAHAGTDVPANYFEGIQFAYDGTSQRWKSTKGPKYWPLDGTLDFLAVASAGTHDSGNGTNLSAANICTWGDDNGNVAGKVAVHVTGPSGRDPFDDILYGAANAQGASTSGTGIAFHHAKASVVFVAKCNVACTVDETHNEGITINGITIDGASYAGMLTITNPAAGEGSGSLTAAWSSLGSSVAHLPARVWDSGNNGIKTDEDALSSLNLGTTYKDISVAANKFGEAYVILPEQPAVPFTITYTVHNGFQADGTTPLNVQLQYQYTPTGTWQMGKKYVYQLDFNLTEILVNPTIVDWNSESHRAAIPTPVYSFAGLQIAPGPLYFNGTNYVIKDSWNYNSYNDKYGKNAGSYYFKYLEMGELFEKEGFTTSDGDIDNTLDPFSGWRLPTITEWSNIISTTRPGSTVNSASNKHYAFVKITDMNNTFGLLLFPDGQTIVGKTLNMDQSTINDLLQSELNNYFEYGCVFLPAFGRYDSNNWQDLNAQGLYLSSTAYDSDNDKVLYFNDSQSNLTYHYSKTNAYFAVRLVR